MRAVENPKISIVIPVYNADKYIDRCMKSIYSQNFPDFEIIFINDASSDGSLEVLKKYASSDDRIRIIDKHINEGQMSARRDGYSVAQGDYIMFVDSDDFIEPDTLNSLYDKIEESRADIVVSGYNYYTVDGQVTTKIYSIPFGESKEGVFRALLERKLYHNLWGNIYNRKLFTSYNYTCLKNQTNGEDMILFYELVSHSQKVVALGKATYGYCQNMESSVNKKRSEEVQRKLINLNLFWYNSMLSQPVEHELLERSILKTILESYLAGYSHKIVTPILRKHSELMKFRKSIKRLGVAKGLFLQLCYHGVVGESIGRNISKLIVRLRGK